MRFGACVSILVLGFVLQSGTALGQGRSEVLLHDDFSGSGIDTTLWTVHGTGTSSPGDSLELWAHWGWDDGVSSRRVFARPPSDSMLIVSGRLRVPRSNWECISCVWLQEVWETDTRTYGIEFDQDEIYHSSHSVDFLARDGGSWLDNLRIHEFQPGTWVGWEFTVYETGCEVAVEGDDGLVWRHTCEEGSFPFRVNLTAQSGLPEFCDSWWDDIEVRREARIVRPRFVADPRSGLAPTTVHFENRTAGEMTSWEWDFGDGSPVSYEQSPSHTYPASGFYDVTLAASGPCGGGTCTADSFLIVRDVFSDDFTGPGIDPEKWVVHGEKTTSEGDSLLIISRLDWSQGAESLPLFERPPEGQRVRIQGRFKYTDESAPSICKLDLREAWAGSSLEHMNLLFLKGDGGGDENEVVLRTVQSGTLAQEAELARFATGPWIGWKVHLLPTGCDVFLDTGSGWEWRLGHEMTSHDARLLLHGAGHGNGYNNFGYWDDIEAIREPQELAAQFEAVTVAGPPPLEVEFIDHSRGDVSSWEWDFGDSTAHSFEQHPVHVYDSVGEYSVTLAVTDPSGTDSWTREAYITVLPSVDFTCTPPSGEAPLVVQFEGACEESVTTWLWDFGDGSPEEEGQTVTHEYAYPGEYDVTLTASGEFGTVVCETPEAVQPYAVWTLDISDPTGVTVGYWAHAWGDYDTDGDMDLYVLNKEGPNALIRNDGGEFVDVTTPVLAGSSVSRSATWVDYDNDCDTDLYIVNYLEPNRLLRNDGGGSFTDVTMSPLDGSGPGLDAEWLDFDLDGDLDVCVTCYDGDNGLYRNDGTLFTDATPSVLAGIDAVQDLSRADYDGDGDPDLLLLRRDKPNVLLRNDEGTFVDASAPPISFAACSFGAAWADFDDDGDLDLYVAVCGGCNVFLQNDGDGTFSDISTWPMNYNHHCIGCAWGDYDNDADLDIYVASCGHYGILARNDGEGVFRDVARNPVDDIQNTRTITWCDYDADGDLDLYNSEMYYHNKLFTNDTEWGNHWLHIDLEGGPSNRDAVSARVHCVTGDLRQMREIGVDTGYLGHSSPTVEFGLGASAVVDSLIVEWPSGGRTTLTAVAADQKILVQETEDAFPGVPSSLTAEPGPDGGTAVVRWSGPDDPDLAGYRVERDTTLLFGAGTVVASVADTMWSDSGLLPWSDAHYRVFALDAAGHQSAPSETLSFEALPTGVDETGRFVHFTGPNPFTRSTSIVLGVPAPGCDVSVRVYDVAGRLVATLCDSPMKAGVHRLSWDGRTDGGHRVASGVYFCRTDIGGERTSSKFVLLR